LNGSTRRFEEVGGDGAAGFLSIAVEKISEDKIGAGNPTKSDSQANGEH